MDVISIEKLTRDYGDGKGIFDVSFGVGNGEVFGFLGPNGAGKTTTIRHLMGFIRPKTGKCTISGLDCWTQSSEIQKNLGYIPGEINFFDDMSGTEFLDFSAKYRGFQDSGRKKALLERFELNPKGKIKKMSKGMKQKIGIVAAFMHDPDILILDEPTSGLDPLMQSRFVELIAEEKKRGKTILLSSHMFEEVERTCDRIGIIREGKLAAVGMRAGATTLMGFMISYLYGFILLVFPMVFCILRGNGLIAKYIDRGSMAALVAAPVKRRTIAFTQMKVLASGIFLLVAYTTVLEILISQILFPGELVVSELLLLNAGLLCLHLFIGSICFLSSCVFSDTKYSVGFGAGIPGLMYVLQMLANVGDKAETAKYFSLFTLFNPDSIVAGETSALAGIAVLLVGTLLLYASGIFVFTKKDLHI